jgi:hypothetical protein
LGHPRNNLFKGNKEEKEAAISLLMVMKRFKKRLYHLRTKEGWKSKTNMSEHDSDQTETS